MKPETIVRALTIAALAGLLGAVGLRLTFGQVVDSLKKCRFVPILLANFVLVPALTVTLAAVFGIRGETAIAMVLLAASPFAPVVPVFARMARADLALAAGLTSIFPVLSALLTPVVCELALMLMPENRAIRFDALGGVLTLAATIILPLGLGMAIYRLVPLFSQRIRRPMEVISEATGAVSLTFVTATEFGSILKTGWAALIAMAVVAELSLALGYWLGGAAAASRRVVALGTSNRNITLALLIALQSFAGTPVVPAVVANGLLLILLGLLHVACWRFAQPGSPPAPA